MPTTNIPPEKRRNPEQAAAPGTSTPERGTTGTPTKEDILREQALSTERQREGHGWASQSPQERRGEPVPQPPRIEPGEGERVPVRNTARLAEEGQRSPPKRQDEATK